MAVDSQASSVADLLQRGIAAARAKSKPEAQALLREVVTRDPSNEQGWLWLAAVADSPEEALLDFQHVLAINPGNQQAQAGVRWAEARQRRTGTQPAMGASSTAPASPPPSGATALPTALQPDATFSTPPLPGSMRATSPDAFFAPPSSGSGRVTEPDAFFTPPAGAAASGAPGGESDLDVATLQRIAEARRAAATEPAAASPRQGFFDISDEDETPAPASNMMLADSTALPTPAPVTMPDDYDDSFAGLDDLANIDEGSAPASRSEETKPAPRRERSINLARQLAMEGAALDRAAGRLDGGPEDATSIEAARANAERRRSSTATTRSASPGLFSSPLLVGVALIVALILVGLVTFSLLNNSGTQPDATVVSFMSAYNKGDTATYNTYLTADMQKRITTDASIQSYLAAYQKDFPPGDVNTTIQKIADDSTNSPPRVEYYLYGRTKQTILDFALEKSGSNWLIDNIGWVGGKLASGFVKANNRINKAALLFSGGLLFNAFSRSRQPACLRLACLTYASRCS